MGFGDLSGYGFEVIGLLWPPLRTHSLHRCKKYRSMLQIHFTEIDFFFKPAKSYCRSGRLRQILGEYA